MTIQNIPQYKDRLPRFSNVYDVEVLIKRLDSDVDIYNRELINGRSARTNDVHGPASQLQIGLDHTFYDAYLMLSWREAGCSF